VISNFEEKDFACICEIFYWIYTTENNVPNGATIPSIMMLENATPLPESRWRC
jgi:deoxyribose-phosphate aldolase